MSSSPAKRPAEAFKGDGPVKKKAKSSKDEAAHSGEKPKKEKGPSAEALLQRSLLESDPQIASRFLQALKAKPADMSKATMARAFWAQRQHLLSAHAIEKEQKRAHYNVLSEVKPKNVEGAIRLNITPEQVNDIFNQHPVVKKAYDETIPGKIKDNMSFWSAFFSSRLFKRLRGERINDKEDSRDPVLDRYLDVSDDQAQAEQGQEVAERHISHFIDLAGNEENHSQRRGNAPHAELQAGREPGSRPIMTALNSLSEKILVQSTPADRGEATPSNANDVKGHKDKERQQKHAPIGMSEEKYNELRLRDLGAETRDDRVFLNIRNAQRFQGAGGGRNNQQTSSSSNPPEKPPKPKSKPLPPDRLLSSLTSTLKSTNLTDLSASIGFPQHTSGDASDSESDTNTKSSSKTSKSKAKPFKTNLSKAQRAITSAIHMRSSEPDDAFFSSTSISSAANDSSSQAGSNTVLSTLPEAVVTDLQLTQGTTSEFLNYFWTTLLTAFPHVTISKDSKLDAPESKLPHDLTPLLTTLTNSLQRLEAVAATAEEDRVSKLKELKRRAAEIQQARGGKSAPKIDEKEAGGGRAAVEGLCASAVRSVEEAKKVFKRVVRAIEAQGGK